MSHQIHTYSELRQRSHYKPPGWTREVFSQRPQLLFIRIQQLIAIATLGILFWLWFGAPTHGTPLQRYPYYDTQEPVPPWTEPGPLQGNYGRAKEMTNEHSK